MAIKSIGEIIAKGKDQLQRGVAGARSKGRRIVDLDRFDKEQRPDIPRQERCLGYMHAAIERARLDGGKLLEIGGRCNPLKEHFPQFEYSALDIKDGFSPDVEVIVADITACPEIPDASYDVIISIDVFEHIAKPWLAGSEITRILKPGGVTIHSTLFSWRYHPCPIDYWRYSPEALASLFPKLKTLKAEFDYTERRKNMTKVSRNGEPPDELGGWRENVRVHYSGMKPRGKRRPGAKPLKR